MGSVFLATAGPASAKTPCWKVLINDWYDGRIDKTYPIPCYQQALRHLPEDVQTYSSARDDIRQALQDRLRRKKSGVGGAGGSTGATGTGTGGTTKPSGGSGSGTGASPSGTKTTGTPGRTGGGPITKAFKKLGPKHADSVPIPLIVLGAIALLLLAAGSAAFAARKIQARRVPVPPNPPQ